MSNELKYKIGHQPETGLSQRTAVTEHGVYTILKKGQAWYGTTFTSLTGEVTRLGWFRSTEGGMLVQPQHSLTEAKMYVEEHVAKMAG